MPVYMGKLQSAQPKRNRIAFLSFWITGHALAWFAYFVGLDLLQGPLFLDNAWIPIIALSLGGITSVTQYLLLRWQFGKNIRWWIPLSVVSWLFAAFVPFAWTIDAFGDSQFDIMIQAFALFAPAALVQAFLLRRYVQQTWLWLLATLAGTSVFAMSVSMLYWADWSVYLGYGTYAGVSALTMLWLFGMSQRSEQAIGYDQSYDRLVAHDTAPQYDYMYDAEEKHHHIIG